MKINRDEIKAKHSWKWMENSKADRAQGTHRTEHHKIAAASFNQANSREQQTQYQDSINSDLIEQHVEIPKQNN